VIDAELFAFLDDVRGELVHGLAELGHKTEETA